MQFLSYCDVCSSARFSGNFGWKVIIDSWDWQAHVSSGCHCDHFLLRRLWLQMHKMAVFIFWRFWLNFWKVGWSGDSSSIFTNSLLLHLINWICSVPSSSVWICACDFSTFCGVHATHSEHGSYGGFARSGTRTLKLGPVLWQEVILHPLHQQPLALHTVPQQRVGLKVCQELHTNEKTPTWTHRDTWQLLSTSSWNKCRVCVYCGWGPVWVTMLSLIVDCGGLRVERELFSHWFRD